MKEENECRSPYCECEKDKCSHGWKDMRGEPREMLTEKNKKGIQPVITSAKIDWPKIDSVIDEKKIDMEYWLAKFCVRYGFPTNFEDLVMVADAAQKEFNDPIRNPKSDLQKYKDGMDSVGIQYHELVTESGYTYIRKMYAHETKNMVRNGFLGTVKLERPEQMGEFVEFSPDGSIASW
jgi:hypothetical protein